MLRMRFRRSATSPRPQDQRGLAQPFPRRYARARARGSPSAFNGSTNVPEGRNDQAARTQGAGVQGGGGGGADTNASTGFDRDDAIELDLPGASDDLIDTGLMLMRETRRRTSPSIPLRSIRERGIILSERRARKHLSVAQPDRSARFPDEGDDGRQPHPGRRPRRSSAMRPRLRASATFYDRYYRPERATLVMVGDFDPAAVEAKITARFSDWKGRGSAGARPEIGNVDFSACGRSR